MNDQQSAPCRPAPLTRPVILARLALGWERLWQALWPSTTVAGGFVALALADIPALLPGWLHAVILLATGTALVLTGARGFRRFCWPTETEAVRRLERDNALAHRPLLTLRDQPAILAEDPLAVAVWQAHRQAVARLTYGLRVRWPHPNLAVHDPLSLRALVGVLLVAAGIVGWGDWQGRLKAALLPHLTAAASQTPASFDVWLTPPAYTGAPTIFLHQAGVPTTSQTEAGPISVPAESLVLARVSGGDGVPVLTVNDAATGFAPVDDNHFQIQESVHDGTAIAVTQGGRTLGRWSIAVVTAAPPVVTFVGPPVVVGQGALRLEYQAAGDYGVAAIGLAVHPVRDDPLETAGSVTRAVSLPAVNQRRLHGTSLQDLTASPWAGRPARLRLTVTDSGGREGVSETVTVTLPERNFSNPVAREIVAQRRLLIAGGEGKRISAATALAELSIHPETFHDDTVVTLALRVGIARLRHDREFDAVSEVCDLLWETALRLEDGGVSLSGRDLAEAERALTEALDRNASPAEIQRRIEELQAALARYLDGLERQALTGAAPQTPLPPGAQTRSVSRSDLEAMTEALRAMTETGSRDEARRMLSNLHQILDDLRQSGGAGSPGQVQAMEMLDKLQELAGQQRQLLDSTNRSPSTPTSEPGVQSAIGQQNQVREKLGALMREVDALNGDIPRPLGQAERAMHAAEQALGAGTRAAAAAAQATALSELQRGMRALADRMSQANGSEAGRDPLGRTRPGRAQVDSPTVHVPEELGLQRAREILDELRRRASQHDRSRQELDYIDRLLRQF